MNFWAQLKTFGSRVLPVCVAVFMACAPAGSLRAAVPEPGPSIVADHTEGEFLPLLKTKTVTYTNVTLRAISDTDVFISHPGGVLNIKLAEFQSESAAAIESVRSKLPRMGSKTDLKAEKKKFSIRGVSSDWTKDIEIGGQQVHLTLAMVAGLFAGWLFFCWCCHLICLKSAVSPGILAWLPVVQIFPLLRAAQMPWWWFLVFLVPGANLVAYVVWSVKVARFRQKGAWLAILLILPPTSPLAFLYLAFSRGLTVDDRRKLDAALQKRYSK